MAARKPLTRERVLRAAIAMADARGIDGISMRKLGHELGVEAMSLYNHVAGKDDVLDGACDLVMADIELPVGDADWASALRASARSAHRTLRRHPWVCERWNRSGLGMFRMRYMDAILGCLRRGGFSVEGAYYAFHAVDTYVVGFTTQELSFQFDAKQLDELAGDFLRDVSPDNYPYLVEHVHEHLKGGAHANEYELGLDLLLEGLERIRSTR